MTALQFEAAHRLQWHALEAAIATLQEGGKTPVDGAYMTALYRQCCEQLAQARARGYPVHLVQRLEGLAQSAHQLIYGQRNWGVAQLAQLLLVDFPQAVRAHNRWLLSATLLFMLPLLVSGWLCWRDSGFILHFMDIDGMQRLRQMYGPDVLVPGRLPRDAGDDFMMFGYYIMNNIGIGLRSFALGLFAGVGSAFVLLHNGLHIGAVSGFLLGQPGYAENFLSFVATHSAFELTGIVLSGAAGLRLGWSWLAPGQHTRLQSLRRAARHAVVLIYGVVALLLLAAAVEAFWSSSRWVAPQVKYGVGIVCWIVVLGWLGWLGRPARHGSHNSMQGKDAPRALAKVRRHAR